MPTSCRETVTQGWRALAVLLGAATLVAACNGRLEVLASNAEGPGIQPKDDAGAAIPVAAGPNPGIGSPDASDLARTDDAATSSASGISQDAAGPDTLGGTALDASDAVAPAPSGPPSFSACAGGMTSIYVLGEWGRLMTFDPTTATFTDIENVQNYLNGVGATSMAVSRSGTAYIEVEASLVRADTSTSNVQMLGYVSVQGGFGNFGMGFVRTAGGGEVLYLAEIPSSGFQARLATVDTATLNGAIVGVLDANVVPAELTGDDTGRLFAFNGSEIFELDPASAQVLARHATGASASGAFAMAGSGQDFYLFTGQTVWRYRPADGSTVQTAAQAPQPIVGAGRGPCR
jgi:hypothetical protein